MTDDRSYRFEVPTFRLVRERSGTYRTMPVIQNASDAARIVRAMATEPQEVFVVLLLNAKGRAFGAVVVHRGTLSSTLVHPREVFLPAIQANAASIILAHNHPSGDPTPSSEDQDVHERLRKAGEIIGIPVLDSIVIGDSGHVSLSRP